ncbi:MAG: hypothetical protein LBN22_10550 [Clostridiales Family XIII bacterium]|jgi:hypothetical protein|nr:hypothetical protein [Clostridiales Family XIII bacterium]
MKNTNFYELCESSNELNTKYFGMKRAKKSVGIYWHIENAIRHVMLSEDDKKFSINGEMKKGQEVKRDFLSLTEKQIYYTHDVISTRKTEPTHILAYTVSLLWNTVSCG